MNKEVSSDAELQSFIGRTLIKVQIFEFLIHGLASHFKPEVLNKTRLAGLTAKLFLSSEKEDKKKRRQTLGQVLDVFRKGAKFAYWEELDNYLEMRNDFVHHFWRDYISKDFDRDRCIKFLTALEMQTEEWTRVFRGLLSIMAKGIMSRQLAQDQETYRNDERYQNIIANEPYEQFLFEKLKTKAS
jgi:hypothetical protein